MKTAVLCAILVLVCGVSLVLASAEVQQAGAQLGHGPDAAGNQATRGRTLDAAKAPTPTLRERADIHNEDDDDYDDDGGGGGGGGGGGPLAGLFDEYDIIVVGGGTAGCVVGARMTENTTDLRVLIIERGYDVAHDPTTVVPTVNFVPPVVAIEYLPAEMFWTIEPLLTASTVDTFAPWALGGGPAVSGSLWSRGDPSNYDEWAVSVGDAGLTYANLLPFFKRSENVLVSDSASPDRGRTGPIEVTFLSHDNPVVLPIAQRQGLVFNAPLGIDYATSNGTFGVWPMQRSLLRGSCNATSGPCVRQSTYACYVEPVLPERPNLNLLINATVTRITFAAGSLLPGWAPRANGVEVLVGGRTHRIKLRAGGEVVASAGTVGSARLLMASGLGPAAQLAAARVPLVKDIAGVGQNLNDHIVMTFEYLLNESVPAVPIASPVTVSFLRSGLDGPHTIDIEVAWGMLAGRVLLGYIVQVRRNTTGSIALRSFNPTERVDMTLGIEPAELGPMIWAFRKVREWLQPFIVDEVLPGAAAIPPNFSDDEMRAWLSGNVNGWGHIAGTCKMGAPTDPTAVVDSSYRVLGVRGLRVVDNSVQPRVVSAHPSATATMLGERAASIMRHERAI